jgi:hypothetical protein
LVETKEFPESEIPVTGLPLLVFDVNETLLDLPARQTCTEYFDQRSSRSGGLG